MAEVYQPLNITTDKAKRCLMMMWVDVNLDFSDPGNHTPEWEVIGRGTEEAYIELDYDEETTTDILCITETVVNNVTESMSLDPFYAKRGSKLWAILDHRLSMKEYSEFNFPILTAKFYKGASGNYEAYVDSKCSIRPQSLGGSSYMDMPIDVTFGGAREHGTVSNIVTDPEKETPVFTPKLQP